MRYTDNVSAVGEAAGRRPAKLGRYELITQIGQGGMAEVQLALQRGPAGFEKLVVVKLVHANLATQKSFVDMLLDEARVAALVKHPNVVDIYDLGEADGRYFIAMEYLEGEPLLAVLRAGREGKRLDPLSTARLIADTAEGLDAAHELRSMGGDPIELVHHDVSLGNIVALYNGQVKLVDFGVAKASMTTAAGPGAKIQGKFSYMAPEKLKGGAGDRRSDIWSLGCVLWEAMTLRRLFKGGNDADTMKQVLEQKIPAPSTVNGDVITDFDPIVMKALERDPAKRYATAKAMAQDLEEVLRKQGYGGRNDQIARYMQATFEDHINARKKLLQEVSSKGRASAAVLQAAFADPAAPSTVATSSEFSIAFKGPPVAEGTPARSLSRGSMPIAVTADSEQTTVDAPPMSEAQAALLAGEDTTFSGATSVDSEVARSEVDEAVIATPASNKRLYLGLGAVAAGLVLVIIIAIAVASGKKSSEGGFETGRGNVASGSDRAIVANVELDAAPVVADAALAQVDAEIEMDPDAGAAPPDAAVKATRDAGVPNPRPPDPPKPPKPNLAELTATGVRELAAGNLSVAIASFKRATAANGGYAPAWRGLGIAYEKQGATAQAITAFNRYLALAPGAGDANSIRDRIERLKK
jgi:serine/threonine protein kinase